jgi:hypothetical protein
VTNSLTTTGSGTITAAGGFIGTSFQPSANNIAITFANITTTGNIDIGGQQTTGNLNLGTGARSATGNINIGGVSVGSSTNTINIGTGSGSTNTINIGRSNVISIVNSTTSTLTLNRPVTIGYTSSIYSETSSAVLSFIGGTFFSTATWSSWASGNFEYIFGNNPTTPATGWTGAGGVSLLSGVYRVNYALSFDDGTAYNITDFRVGISTLNNLTIATTDGVFISSCPGGNLSCYRHHVTTITPAASDIVVEQLSSCFRLSATTSIYPYLRCNNSATGGINTIIADFTITRVG